ncbi:vesicle transport v-SNARE 13-like [Arachis stenosperma]|uniref:vesicle transport v-SNARE 13-like n=1 Tax=Arachis stenosperma TaxID=217475 RepID=UPI0025AC7721|nr:vesicle transport v-SNARE 13-like [Arachis stenosperma]
MELEARSLQASMKASLLVKLKEYETDLNNLKSELKRITSVVNNNNDELLELGQADTLVSSNDHRRRLVMFIERLNMSFERIKESRRSMLETEELGASILQDLHQQRHSLLHAHNTLRGVDDNIDESNKILTAISRRMSTNKWIFGSFMVAIVLAIILITFY